LGFEWKQCYADHKFDHNCNAPVDQMVLSRKRWNAEHKDEHHSVYYGASPQADLLCLSGHFVCLSRMPQTTESIVRQRRAAGHGIYARTERLPGPHFGPTPRAVHFECRLKNVPVKKSAKRRSNAAAMDSMVEIFPEKGDFGI
jgi:hypothetical protein